MVTSRAVVGSSAIEQPGLADQRHGDRHPLPHAAGELVRVARQPLGRLRHADQPQDLLGPVPRRSALVDVAGAAAAARRPGRRSSGRVERGQRVLEDHADGVAADLAQAGFGGGGQVACPSNRIRPPVILPPGGSRPRTDSAVMVLPQPDSPTMPSASPAARSRSMPSRAWTVRPRPAISTCRSSILQQRVGHGVGPRFRSSETASVPASRTSKRPAARPDEVEGGDDQHDREARREDQPPVADLGVGDAGGEQGAPVGGGRRDGQARGRTDRRRRGWRRPPGRWR